MARHQSRLNARVTHKREEYWSIVTARCSNLGSACTALAKSQEQLIYHLRQFYTFAGAGWGTTNMIACLQLNVRRCHLSIRSGGQLHPLALKKVMAVAHAP